MALPTPRGKEGWITLAELRIINILRARIAANIRQLEAKICESGPPEKRPEPHNLGAALGRLRGSGRVRTFTPAGESTREDTRFYYLRGQNRAELEERVADLLVAYRTHRMLTDKEEYCSRVLEGLVRNSFDATGRYQFLGRLPAAGPLDGVYQLGTPYG